MSFEESLTEKLLKEFPFIAEKCRIQRARRICIETEYEKFQDVFSFIVEKLDFPILCTITGLDENEKISAIYHLANNQGVVLNLKTGVPKENPVIKSITGSFPHAAMYERELEDLLGVVVEGLPKGKRYPLPDTWPAGEYPLRKSWKMKQ